MSEKTEPNVQPENPPSSGPGPAMPMPYWPLWPLQPMPCHPPEKRPSPQEVVPGNSLLGKGFNIFGRYNSSSARRMLIDTTKRTENVWQNPLSGNVYVVPENVDDPQMIGAHEGSSHSFSSRADVSNYFAAEAGLSAQYRVFSGEFKAAFSSISSSVQDYHMALYTVKSRSYRLRLKEDCEAKLCSSFLEDPDYKSLPATFNPNDHGNVAKFFSFFAKFGTHYVNEIVMGARLDYFMYAEKSLVESQKKFEANLRAEVKAVFFSAKTTASTEWQALTKEWAQSRTVRVSTVGSVSILNGLVPEYEQNFHEYYSQWLAMSQAAPMPVEYKLKCIADLFSGDKALAIRMALDAYASKSVVLKAAATPFARALAGGHITYALPNKITSLPQGFVNLNESVVLTAPTSHEKLAISIVVIDARTLEVKFKQAYEFPNHDKYSVEPGSMLHAPSKSAYDAAYRDFQAKFGNAPDKSELIVAVLIPWVSNKVDFPTSEFYNLLMNLGAGDALNEWWRGLEENTSVLGLRVAYGIVGMFRGAITASTESFVTYYTQDRSSGGLTLESFLEPRSDGKSFIYIPS
jgi:hypothetical protein